MTTLRLRAGLAGLVALTIAGVAAPAMARVEFDLWHAHSPDITLGKTIARYAAEFNAAQSDYQVNAVFKGSYDDVINGAIAAARAGKAPAIVQVHAPAAPTVIYSKAAKPVDEVMAEDAFERIAKAMMADLDKALDGLAAMRAEEGRRLLAVMTGQIDQVAGLTERAATVAGTQPEAIRQRLNEQVQRLIDDNPGMPEERLAQEAAMLMTKADIREELDRLIAHTAAAREMLEKADGPVGRRLDFLCQEFNREANTLCSKSPDTDLTAISLDLKTVIDQLREQVQNIE